jgi:hypothetical protein
VIVMFFRTQRKRTSGTIMCKSQIDGNCDLFQRIAFCIATG